MGPVRRWHPAWLLAAPHRLAFFAAALMLGGSALWWAVVLLLAAQGVVLPWAVQPGLAHALLMGYGFMPLFFTGFLFTAGPRWLQVAAPSARALALPVGAMLAGWAVFLFGAHWHAFLAGVGTGVAALGWSALTLRFIGLVRASAAADRTHARVVAVACGVGVLLLWSAAAGLLTDLPPWVRAAVQAGLWGCMAVVYVTVSHRMIPFFTASAMPVLDAWRPMWLLWTLVAALVFEVPFAVAEPWWWPLPAALRWLQVAVELPVSGLLLWLAWRWGLVQSLRMRLLAMLHLGFVWLGLAYALAAASHALMALTGGALSLGLAPLHALTIGFLGSTLVAMATRVSCGHGGRTLAADDFVWRLFWLLQLAALARVAAALWAAGTAVLIPLAALGWAACMLAWALRYGGWFLQPRPDGRPG